MKRLLLLLLLTVSCSTESVEVDLYADCKPSIPKMEVSQADENGLIEFDIIPDIQNKGVAITDKIWSSGIIHYYIQGHRQVSGGVMLGFESQEDLQKIRYAIDDFWARTGIVFIEHNSPETLRLVSPNGIRIERGFSGGSSHLGMQGGIQRLTLPTGLEQSVTQHEIGHALGLLHEFKRSDRDEYVTIIWENIPERMHNQFELDPTSVDCGNFDLESIMMYGSFEVKKDSTSPEMTLLNGKTFERLTTLSDGDIRTIKSLYELEFNKR